MDSETTDTVESVTKEVLRRLSESPAEYRKGPQSRTGRTQPRGPSDSVARDAPRPVMRNGCLEVPVYTAVSVRHVHLCEEHVAVLFGVGHDLQLYHELYQKGYFAAQERLIVVGPKRALEEVRVLGPVRAFSQVELAGTDALTIGLKLPVRTNGGQDGTQPITLVGPQGAVRLPGGKGGGAFLARRHIHLSEVTAAEYGVKAGDLLDLRVDGPRPSTFHGIFVRTKAGWKTEVHIDTDEGNAAGIRSGQNGTLIIPQ